MPQFHLIKFHKNKITSGFFKLPKNSDSSSKVLHLHTGWLNYSTELVFS